MVLSVKLCFLGCKEVFSINESKKHSTKKVVFLVSVHAIQKNSMKNSLLILALLVCANSFVLGQKSFYNGLIYFLSFT